jgi:hypothetical protein
VSPNQVGTRAGILSKVTVATSHFGYGMHMTAAGVLEAWVSDGAASRVATGTTALVAGRWYHCAMVWDDTANTISIYLNGVLEAQTGGGAFTVAAGTEALLVNAARNNVQSYANWLGSITEVSVHSAVLTATQIRAIYNRGLWALGSQLVSPEGWSGSFLTLDPRAGTTNTVEIRADHGSSAPTPRSVLAWRSRYL